MSRARTPLARTQAALVLCLALGAASCLPKHASTVQTITEAVCLGITAITEDGKAHEVCARAEDLAPFVDAIIHRQRERAALDQATRRLGNLPPVRVQSAELAALDCPIPAR